MNSIKPHSYLSKLKFPKLFFGFLFALFLLHYAYDFVQLVCFDNNDDICSFVGDFESENNSDQEPESENENETQIDAIPVEISLDRFDLKFYNQPASVIPNLKSQYPFLFPKQFSDSIWISRQTDSLQLLLQNEVNKTFESTDLIESELSHLFKHIKFYFPSTVVPKVMPLNQVTAVMKCILEEGVPISDLRLILESISSMNVQKMDSDDVAERIRPKLVPLLIQKLINRLVLFKLIPFKI